MPKHEAELKKITGAAITYEVDWDSFADNLRAMENLEPKGLQPLGEIFRQITSDKIGKDAVKDSIQTIYLSQTDDCNIARFLLNDGVLSMPWDWKSYGDSFFPDGVREKIESLL